jgi:hypothetical protein
VAKAKEPTISQLIDMISKSAQGSPVNLPKGLREMRRADWEKLERAAAARRGQLTLEAELASAAREEDELRRLLKKHGYQTKGKNLKQLEALHRRAAKLRVAGISGAEPVSPIQKGEPLGISGTKEGAPRVSLRETSATKARAARKAAREGQQKLAAKVAKKGGQLKAGKAVRPGLLRGGGRLALRSLGPLMYAMLAYQGLSHLRKTAGADEESELERSLLGEQMAGYTEAVGARTGALLEEGRLATLADMAEGVQAVANQGPSEELASIIQGHSAMLANVAERPKRSMGEILALRGLM